MFTIGQTTKSKRGPHFKLSRAQALDVQRAYNDTNATVDVIAKPRRDIGITE